MNKKEIDAPTLVLIIIIMMAIINGLTSCASNRIVYQQDLDGKVWKTHSTISAMTGYKYKK
jgi:hypothetical protein